MLAGLLALAGICHAQEDTMPTLPYGDPPRALINLYGDIMREYPTAGRPAAEVKWRCEDVALNTQRFYELRLMGIELARLHRELDALMVEGQLDAKGARYGKGIATYAYGMPLPDKKLTTQKEMELNAKAFATYTLVQCRQHLER